MSVLRQRLRPPEGQREPAGVWMRREWKWLALTAMVIVITIGSMVSVTWYW